MEYPDKIIYLDEENIRKANQVRELVNLGKIEEAETISLELGKYLERKYPLDFRIWSGLLSNEENKKKFIECLAYRANYNLFLFYSGDFEDKRLVVFINGTGEYFITMSNLYFPDEFYQFCEVNGLTPRTINYLYSGTPSFKDRWPYLVKSKLG